MESHLMTTVVMMILAWRLSLSPCTCEVNVTWMKDALTQHFSHPRNHVTNPQYKHQTMAFIRDQFRDMGLESHLDIFPTDISNVTGINVIGVLKGRYFNTKKDRIVGIGAHYDTMPNTPGVDDNGAGVVVMLEAARELSHRLKAGHQYISQKPLTDYTILFIAFDFEEWENASVPMSACRQISCGSRSLVQHWLPNFFPTPLSWTGIFVMDTIFNFDDKNASQNLPLEVGQLFPEQAKDITADGDRGDFLMVAGRKQDQPLMDKFHAAWDNKTQQQYKIENFVVPPSLQYNSDFSRSDHTSFWKGGLKAVFLTDTANFRGYMTACYHAPCDAIGHVTPAMMDFAGKTCRTLVSVLSETAHLTSSSGGQLVSTPLMVVLLMIVVMFR